MNAETTSPQTEPQGEADDKPARKAQKKALKEARKAEKQAEKQAEKDARKAEKDARKAAKKARKAEEAAQAAPKEKSRKKAAKGEGATMSHSLSSALQAAARHARTLLANRLLEHGLYAGQEQVLFLLEERGPLALGDLAVELDVRAPTITKTVTRMEGQGFLSRAVSAEDARSIIISLTPEGRKALAGARLSVSQAEQAAFSEMDDEARAALQAMLARVLAAKG